MLENSNNMKCKSFNYQFYDFLFCPKIVVIKHLTEKGVFYMEYSEVLDYFKKDIRNNPDIEIIRLKHGYMIFYWDEVENSYYQVNELIQSPKKLYEILNKELNK